MGRAFVFAVVGALTFGAPAAHAQSTNFRLITTYEEVHGNIINRVDSVAYIADQRRGTVVACSFRNQIKPDKPFPGTAKNSLGVPIRAMIQDRGKVMFGRRDLAASAQDLDSHRSFNGFT
ncbi:hypothetical protein [Candidatus Burkholderia verschuerenii]|uniref:hypothetical protein n=1 Tax=Candidatus Burkholderia verschuerenii TaxID=242163 RepID=UPI00067C3BB7|nr:hypothetical protein [Candidatus Burkholderia verschuerenii]